MSTRYHYNTVVNISFCLIMTEECEEFAWIIWSNISLYHYCHRINKTVDPWNILMDIVINIFIYNCRLCVCFVVVVVVAMDAEIQQLLYKMECTISRILIHKS